MKSIPKPGYPNNFYTSQNRSQASYSATPPGEPDINRALSGERYWRRNEQKIRRPKKLIISDWPQYWHGYQFNRCKSVVLQLLHDGFEVFYFDGNDIQSLNLSTLGNITNITKDEDYDENILNIAAQKNWGAENILIVNDDLLRAIETRNFRPENVLYASSLKSLTEEDGKALMAEKPDASLIEDHYPSPMNSEPKYCSQIKNRICIYTQMSMSLEEYFDLLDDEHSVLHKNWNNLKQLEININDEIDSDSNRPLELPPGLKTLKINGNHHTESKLYFSDREQPELENLLLNKVSIDSHSLTSLIRSSSTALNTLELNNMLGWNAGTIGDLQLPMLINVKFNGDLSGNALLQLLSIAPSLQSVRIEGSTLNLISDQGKLPELKRLPLKKLILDDVRIDSNLLFTMLRHMPVLSILKFESEVHINGELTESQKEKPISLPEISKMDLFLVDASADTFSFLLRGMTHLKKLLQGGANQLVLNDPIIENKELPLSHITWNSCDITMYEICELLDEFRSIKTITLTDCHKITEYVNSNDSDRDSESEEESLGQYPQVKKVIIADIGYDLSDSEYNMTLYQLRNYLQRLFPNARLVMPEVRINPAPKPYQPDEMLPFDPSQLQDQKPVVVIPPYNLHTKDQNMVIGRLVRYLKVKGDLPEKQEQVRAMIQGICAALSMYFKLHGKDGTNALLELLLAWDGDLNTVDETTEKMLKQIYDLYLAVYEEKSLRNYTYYLGDNLELFLHHVSKNHKFTLANTIHMVALERISSELWNLYDPNCSAGIREIAHDELTVLLHRELGPLLAFESTNWQETAFLVNQMKPYKAISDFNEFLAQGGLYFLNRSVNHNLLFDSKTPLTHKAREGLFLRSVDYIPMWLSVLSAPVNPSFAHWILEQLHQFMENNPDTYAQKISSSVSESIQEAMDTIEQLIKSPSRYGLTLDANGDSILLEKEFCSTGERDLDTHFREFYEKLHKVIFSIPYIVAESPPLIEATLDITSETQEPAMVDKIVDDSSLEPEISSNEPMELQSGMDNMTENPWLKRLEHEKNTTTVITNLDEYCHKIGNNEVNNRLIALNTQEELKDFKYHLVRHYNKANPVFVINQLSDANYRLPWVQYEGNMVRVRNEAGGPFYDFLTTHQDTPSTVLIDFSSMTTEEMISTVKIFKEGLLKLPEQCQLVGLALEGTQKQDYMSFFTNKEKYSMPQRSFNEAMDIDEENPLVIKLFQRSDWKSYLFGTLIPATDGVYSTYQHKEGKLSKALRTGRTVILEDAPLTDPEFNSFWQEYANSGIVYLNQVHKLLPTQRILFRERQVMPMSSVSVTNSPPPESILCNPGLAYKLFPHYTVKGTTLAYTKGKLASTSAKELHIHLTRPLSQEQLDRALYVAEKRKLKLSFSLANTQEHSSIRPDNVPVTLLKSVDQDAAIAVLQKNMAGELLIVDVSELELSELLKYVEVLPGKGLFGQMQKRAGVVLDALSKGQTVILSGIFTEAVADGLAPLITKLETTSTLPGRLILAPQDSEPFRYVKNQIRLELSLEQKLSLLPQSKHRVRLKSRDYENQSLPQLRAILRAMEQGSVDPWKGIRELSLNYSGFHIAADFYETAETCARQFNEERIAAVKRALENEPYVLLTGLTGVGKTSFVEEYARAGNYTLYHGLDSLKEYAKDSEHRDDKPKLVFIDESNLIASDYTVLEGLYQNPPFIIVEGKKIPWGPNDKLFGAMNPLSYGDERSLSRFFERHGQAVVFEPLSLAFIYQKILEPVFSQTNLDMNAQRAICTPILEFYAELCRISSTEVLISPRELQMIALLTIANLQNRDPSETVRHFIWQIGRDLVPPTYFKRFEQHFGEKEEPNYTNKLLNNSYLVTPSRSLVVNQLQELTNLQRYKQENNVRFSGLGGFILEGDPGIGKYELVKAYLAQNRLSFYEITLEMPLAEKERILLQAFHEGTFVLIRHMNCAPMMERLLNCLLMGQTPEGVEAKKPGFFVIGTQNPITLPGRRAASSAVKRRIITVPLSEYPAAEFYDVIKAKGFATEDASLLLDAYQHMRKKITQADALNLPFFAPTKRPEEKVDDPRPLKRPRHGSTSESTAHKV